jgi:hypothetical protein
MLARMSSGFLSERIVMARKCSIVLTDHSTRLRPLYGDGPNASALVRFGVGRFYSLQMASLMLSGRRLLTFAEL